METFFSLRLLIRLNELVGLAIRVKLRRRVLLIYLLERRLVLQTLIHINFVSWANIAYHIGLRIEAVQKLLCFNILRFQIMLERLFWWGNFRSLRWNLIQRATWVDVHLSSLVLIYMCWGPCVVCWNLHWTLLVSIVHLWNQKILLHELFVVARHNLLVRALNSCQVTYYANFAHLAFLWRHKTWPLVRRIRQRRLVIWESLRINLGEHTHLPVSWVLRNLVERAFSSSLKQGLLLGTKRQLRRVHLFTLQHLLMS